MKHPQQGAILIISIMVLLILTGLAMMAYTVSVSTQKSSNNFMSSNVNLKLASDAVFAEAKNWLLVQTTRPSECTSVNTGSGSACSTVFAQNGGTSWNAVGNNNLILPDPKLQSSSWWTNNARSAQTVNLTTGATSQYIIQTISCEALLHTRRYKIVTRVAGVGANTSKVMFNEYYVDTRLGPPVTVLHDSSVHRPWGTLGSLGTENNYYSELSGNYVGQVVPDMQFSKTLINRNTSAQFDQGALTFAVGGEITHIMFNTMNNVNFKAYVTISRIYQTPALNGLSTLDWTNTLNGNQPYYSFPVTQEVAFTANSSSMAWGGFGGSNPCTNTSFGVLSVPYAFKPGDQLYIQIVPKNLTGSLTAYGTPQDSTYPASASYTGGTSNFGCCGSTSGSTDGLGPCQASNSLSMPNWQTSGSGIRLSGVAITVMGWLNTFCGPSSADVSLSNFWEYCPGYYTPPNLSLNTNLYTASPCRYTYPATCFYPSSNVQNLPIGVQYWNATGGGGGTAPYWPPYVQ